jgi:ATP synthase protein I
LPSQDYKWMRKAGLASSIGLVFVVAIVLGWAFGSWLDSKLATSPYLMLLFTLLGVVAGFVEMIQIAQQLSKED